MVKCCECKHYWSDGKGDEVCNVTHDWIYPKSSCDDFISKNKPANVVERKHGKWEMKPDPYGFFDEIPVCSECGCTTKMREKYNFCPNCGADMRESEGEE